MAVNLAARAWLSSLLDRLVIVRCLKTMVILPGTLRQFTTAHIQPTPRRCTSI
jgi:hypothetical protein